MDSFDKFKAVIRGLPFAFGGHVLCSHQRLLARVLVHFIIAGVEIKWVNAVDVPIDGVASICSIEGGGEVVTESEIMDALAHTIEIVVLRQW